MLASIDVRLIVQPVAGRYLLGVRRLNGRFMVSGWVLYLAVVVT